MKKLKLLLWIMILALIVALLSIYMIGKKLNPIILRYSNVEAKRFGVYVINSAIDKNYVNSIDDDIFKTTVNSKNAVIKFISGPATAIKIFFQGCFVKCESFSSIS